MTMTHEWAESKAEDREHCGSCVAKTLSHVPNAYLQALLNDLLVHTRGSRCCGRHSKAVTRLNLLQQLQACNWSMGHAWGVLNLITAACNISPPPMLCTRQTPVPFEMTQQHQPGAMPVCAPAVLPPANLHLTPNR